MHNTENRNQQKMSKNYTGAGKYTCVYVCIFIQVRVYMCVLGLMFRSLTTTQTTINDSPLLVLAFSLFLLCFFLPFLLVVFFLPGFPFRFDKIRDLCSLENNHCSKTKCRFLLRFRKFPALLADPSPYHSVCVCVSFFFCLKE